MTTRYLALCERDGFTAPIDQRFSDADRRACVAAEVLGGRAVILAWDDEHFEQPEPVAIWERSHD